MTAARRTKNGASAGTRRTSSKRKAPTRASGRASSSIRSTAPKRAPRRRTRADRRLVTGALLIAVVLAIWVLYPAFQLQYQQERQKATLEQELAGLRERNETLLAQVERLKTPEGVEEAAREGLGLAKAGEQVYIVTEGEATRAAEPDVTQQARSVTVPEAALLTKALDFIFGVR